MFLSKTYQKKRLRLIGNHVGPGRILDVGYAQAPNKYLLGANRYVMGVDLNSPPKDDTGYDELHKGDVFDFSDELTAQPFDFIVAAEFIEHVENPYEILRLFKKSLKPNGCLILTTPNPLGLPVLFYELIRSKKRFFSFDHTYYFLPRWLIKMLEDVGFKVETVKGVGIWPFGVPCPTSLSYQILYKARIKNPFDSKTLPCGPSQ